VDRLWTVELRKVPLKIKTAPQKDAGSVQQQASRAIN
jgi:hypothetical protein